MKWSYPTNPSYPCTHRCQSQRQGNRWTTPSRHAMPSEFTRRKKAGEPLPSCRWVGGAAPARVRVSLTSPASGVRPPPSRSQPWELLGLLSCTARPRAQLSQLRQLPNAPATVSPETALRHAPDPVTGSPYATRSSSARSTRLARMQLRTGLRRRSQRRSQHPNPNAPRADTCTRVSRPP